MLAKTMSIKYFNVETWMLFGPHPYQNFWLRAWCAPARPAAHFLCSTARIRQNTSAASFFRCKLLSPVMSVFYNSVLARSLIFLQL